MSTLEKQVKGILQYAFIIAVVILGSYYYNKIPKDLEQIKLVVYGAVGTTISTTLPLYLVKRRRAKVRPFMTSKNTFDVAYHTHTYADTKKIQVYIDRKIPSLIYEPLDHYLLPQQLEVCDVDINEGYFEFGDITMNSNVSEINNLKKVPRGFEIRGKAAERILYERQQIETGIEKRKNLNTCDKKQLDVYYSLKDSGIKIKE